MMLVFSESEKQKFQVYLQRKLRETQTEWMKAHLQYSVEVQPKMPCWTDKAVKLANRNGQRQAIRAMLEDFKPNPCAPKRALPTVEMLQG